MLAIFAWRAWTRAERCGSGRAWRGFVQVVDGVGLGFGQMVEPELLCDGFAFAFGFGLAFAFAFALALALVLVFVLVFVFVFAVILA